MTQSARQTARRRRWPKHAARGEGLLPPPQAALRREKPGLLRLRLRRTQRLEGGRAVTSAPAPWGSFVKLGTQWLRCRGEVS